MAYTPTYRLFSIVAYDDSENLSISDLLSYIKLNNFNYFYIKHDKDNKKIHYHICLYFPTAVTLSYVAKKLLIENNNINVTDDEGKRYTLKKSIGYLLHYNNKEKYNYEYGTIKTNMKDTLDKYFDILAGGNNESNNLKEILQFISMNHICSIQKVLSYCIDNNLLKTFKRYGYILNQIIIEERSL